MFGGDLRHRAWRLPREGGSGAGTCSNRHLSVPRCPQRQIPRRYHMALWSTQAIFSCIKWKRQSLPLADIPWCPQKGLPLQSNPGKTSGRAEGCHQRRWRVTRLFRSHVPFPPCGNVQNLQTGRRVAVHWENELKNLEGSRKQPFFVGWKQAFEKEGGKGKQMLFTSLVPVYNNITNKSLFKILVSDLKSFNCSFWRSRGTGRKALLWIISI